MGNHTPDMAITIEYAREKFIDWASGVRKHSRPTKKPECFSLRQSEHVDLLFTPEKLPNIGSIDGITLRHKTFWADSPDKALALIDPKIELKLPKLYSIGANPLKPTDEELRRSIRGILTEEPDCLATLPLKAAGMHYDPGDGSLVAKPYEIHSLSWISELGDWFETDDMPRYWLDIHGKVVGGLVNQKSLNILLNQISSAIPVVEKDSSDYWSFLNSLK